MCVCMRVTAMRNHRPVIECHVWKHANISEAPLPVMPPPQKSTFLLSSAAQGAANTDQCLAMFCFNPNRDQLVHACPHFSLPAELTHPCCCYVEGLHLFSCKFINETNERSNSIHHTLWSEANYVWVSDFGPGDEVIRKKLKTHKNVSSRCGHIWILLMENFSDTGADW